MKSAHYAAAVRAAASSIVSTKRPAIARPPRRNKTHLTSRLLRRKGLITHINLLRRARLDLKHTLNPSERTRRRHHINHPLTQCRLHILQERPTPQQRVLIHILYLRGLCRLQLWIPTSLVRIIQMNTHSHSYITASRVCRRERKVLTRGFRDAEARYGNAYWALHRRLFFFFFRFFFPSSLG